MGVYTVVPHDAALNASPLATFYRAAGADCNDVTLQKALQLVAFENLKLDCRRVFILSGGSLLKRRDKLL